MENKLWTMLEQYLQEGKDMHALRDDYAALTAAGKTPLGLKQWVKSDKPQMEDFNEDNRILDQNLRELHSAKADKGRPADNEPFTAFSPGIEAFGTGYRNSYAKDQFSRVELLISAKKSFGNYEAGIVNLGVLPADLRPGDSVPTYINYSLNGSSVNSIIITGSIMPDGRVVAHIPASPSYNVCSLITNFRSAT